ncbi:MAG: protease modulator HflK N-terminal domain-containing protein [Gammaproteobacteria bacterium]
MSWHEPGRDRDPWRDPKDGPPDLDEWLRRTRRRLRAWFDRRRRPPRPHGKRFSHLWWFLPVALIGIWLLTGFYRVPAHHQGVGLRFGAFTGLSGPGLHWHWPWPIASDRLVDVSENRSISQQATVLTRDGKLLNLGITVAYRISDPYQYLFGSRQPTRLVTALANATLARVARTEDAAALHADVAKGTVGKSIEAHIVGVLDTANAGVTLQSVKIGRIGLPDAVEESRQTLAKVKKANAEAAKKADAAAKKAQLATGKKASRLIAEAEKAAAAREALAHERATHFAALLPAWKQSPETARATLRANVLAETLGTIPKVVVSGSVHSVTLPSTPASAHAAKKAATPASAPATGGGA